MRTLYFILLLCWIAGMTYWSNKTFCGSNSAKPAATSAVGATTAKGGCDRSLLITDGNFQIASERNFSFIKGTDEYFKPKEQLVKALTELSTRLEDMYGKTILIEGLYTKDETESIGLSRAEAVKTYLIEKHNIPTDKIKLGSNKVKACYTQDSKGTIKQNKGIAITFGEE